MKSFSSILSFVIISLVVGTLVTHAQNYTPLAPLPGTIITDDTVAGVGTTDISTYLSGAIKLLVALGAALAVLFAIIGGTQYVAAGISPDAKSGAKERILNSFIGLAIVLTSYLLLNSINPNLVRFNFMLPPVGTTILDQYQQLGGGSVSTSCPNPNDTRSACCPSGVACKACSNCSEVANSNVVYKDCGAGYTCFLNTALLSKIKNIQASGWRITESWPPTVSHLSSCHQDGTCADLNNSGGSTDPATIKGYYDVFRAAGLTVVYESTNCAPYLAAGITNCQTYSTMTNHSSFHVR